LKRGYRAMKAMHAEIVVISRWSAMAHVLNA
jgi:hypothetical protein